MSLRPAASATFAHPPSFDLEDSTPSARPSWPKESTMRRINEILTSDWHFSEESRDIWIQDLGLVAACYQNDKLSAAATLAPRIVAMLHEAGWVLDLNRVPEVIRVLRPAHLPPAVRHVDGAWVPVTPEAGPTP